MPKIKTFHTITKNENGETILDYKVDIQVNSRGIFTCTLPDKISHKFIIAKIELHTNGRRNGKVGYLEGKSLDSLENQIEELGKLYTSREKISEQIVILYKIQTTCSYMINTNNDFVPNGGSAWGECPDYWKDGTVETNSGKKMPYGLLMFVKPQNKVIYKYRNGDIKTFYENVNFPNGNIPSEIEEGMYNLRFLDGLTSIAHPNYNRSFGLGENRFFDTDEIEYTEEIAGVFVGMLKSIFSMNEKIKDCLTPENIREIAMNKQKLLS